MAQTALFILFLSYSQVKKQWLGDRIAKFEWASPQGSQKGERKCCSIKGEPWRKALGHNHEVSTKNSKNYSKIFYEVLKLWKLGRHEFESVKLLELHITTYW